MARYNIRFYLQVTDFNGDVAEISFPTNDADTVTAAALATQMGNFVTYVTPLTNGKITRQRVSIEIGESAYVVGVSPPADNKYPSVTDGGRLQFADGAGERMSCTVPAPVEAMFGTNSLVVDPLQADVANLITQVETSCSSPANSLYALYKGGIKVGRRARRRRSALVP